MRCGPEEYIDDKDFWPRQFKTGGWKMTKPQLKRLDPIDWSPALLRAILKLGELGFRGHDAWRLIYQQVAERQQGLGPDRFSRRTKWVLVGDVLEATKKVAGAGSAQARHREV